MNNLFLINFDFSNTTTTVLIPGSLSSKSRESTLFCVRARNMIPITAPITTRLRQENKPRKILKKKRKNVQTWKRRL